MPPQSYRDRLLGRLHRQLPGGGSSLFQAEARTSPTSHPDGEDLVERFSSELRAVGGECILWLANSDSLALREALSSLEGSRAAMDNDPGWDEIGVDVVAMLKSAGLQVDRVGRDTGSKDMAEVRLGVTLADGAIAETGSILQLAKPFRPRSLSLLPTVHLAVLPAGRLVAGLEEALGMAVTEPAESAGATPEPYVTWITGPSRTADIEKVLTIGVHGPGRLIVAVIVEESTT